MDIVECFRLSGQQQVGWRDLTSPGPPFGWTSTRRMVTRSLASSPRTRFLKSKITDQCLVLIVRKVLDNKNQPLGEDRMVGAVPGRVQEEDGCCMSRANFCPKGNSKKNLVKVKC